MIIVVLMFSGLLLLYAGAELLVRGSANIALRAGISTLIVGLTIVAFGTSSPELVISVRAGIEGSGNIAVGNVIGSNIFNIAVILGISAIIRPISINLKLLRTDMPILVIVSFLPFLFLGDKMINRPEAAILAGGIIVYLYMTIKLGRKEQGKIPFPDFLENSNRKSRPLIIDILFIGAGLTGLVFGSRFFVDGAVRLANIFNISDAVIGLTIVSAGTGLPELATSVVAAIKKEEDIAVGNVVGSNIFNLLAVTGIAGIITPLGSDEIKTTDIVMMIVTTLFLLPLMRTGFRVSRIEGVLLLMLYMAYLWYLWP